MRWWRSSLRLRLAVGSVSLAAVTFVAGAAFVLTIYHRTLVADQERTVESTARGVAANLGRGPLPRPIPMPVGGGVPRVQVIDAAGRVVTGDPVLFDEPPMLTLPTGETTRAVTVNHPSFLPAHRARVVAVRASSGPASLTVVAALSLDPADDKAAQAERLAAIALGVSLAAVAAAAWATTGRALRSVERLRSDVATITMHGALTQRVPAGPDEIGRLAGTLNQMLASLERSTDRQRRFVADAAHELRTPLAGVTAALEVAREHPGMIDPAELNADLLTAVRRVTSLVNDLLTLAGLDEGATAHHRPVELAGVVEDAVRRPIPTNLCIDLEVHGPVMVAGDEVQLGRVVTNLVDNALRYAHTLVVVRLSQVPEGVVLTVADDGPGIPIGDRERVWERFVRLDEDRNRERGGVGLGLALVRELVEAHRGNVTVADNQPFGALFTVRLAPLVSETARPPHSGHSAAGRSRPPASVPPS